MEKSIDNIDSLNQDNKVEKTIDGILESNEEFVQKEDVIVNEADEIGIVSITKEDTSEASLEYTTSTLDLVQFIKDEMALKETDVRTYSPLTLAFIGDVVYDLVIRTMVVEQGNAPVNKLHKRVSNIVKAPAQMEIFHKIEPVLTEEEMGIYKRGRNAKSFTSAKNASITEYRIATGFEALMGYLYLDNKFPRIVQLIKYGLDQEKK